MHINIIGAASAGTTTLGKALSAQMGYPYFDSDEYFWEKTDMPFTVKRDKDIRNNALLNDIAGLPNWIIGSPIFNWKYETLPHFDLVIFLYIPLDIRMERLKKREHERYGDAIFTNPERNKLYNDFIEWSAGYDNNTVAGSRTLARQREWLASLDCPVLEIIGDTSVEERVERVLNKIAGI